MEAAQVTEPSSLGESEMLAHQKLREAATRLAELNRLILELQKLLGTSTGMRSAPCPPSELPAIAETAARLTHREREVVHLLVQGDSNRRIARTLNITEPTVKNHLHVIFLKLNVTGRTQAIAKLLGSNWNTATPVTRPQSPTPPLPDPRNG